MRLNPSRTGALRFDGEDTTYNYVGEAAVNSSTASAVWRIYRLDNTSRSIIKQWADGDDLFNNVWDNRASLSYS